MNQRNIFLATIFLFFYALGGVSLAGQFEDALQAASRGQFETAIRLWLPLAEAGNVSAQNNLGYMFSRGEGVPRDDVIAVKWWRLAAANGLADAQNNLGICYGDGRGVPQDYVEAVKWFRMAAEQGYAMAQSNMGARYGIGEGVNQDWEQSTAWYRLAAEQGDPIGMSNLGVAFANGQGVKRDFIQAYAWYTLAKATFPNADEYGRELAQSNRSAIAKFMTPHQIETARTTASQWKPKKN